VSNCNSVNDCTLYSVAANVLGWRRLGQVIGQCEALTPAPNVAETKPHKGQSPTAVFRSLAARTGRRTLTVC